MIIDFAFFNNRRALMSFISVVDWLVFKKPDLKN